MTSKPQATVYYPSPFYGPAYPAFRGSANFVSAALTTPAAVPLPALSAVSGLPTLSSYPVSAYSYGTTVSVQEYPPYLRSEAVPLVLSSAYMAGAPFSTDFMYGLGK